jgi:hypothetical protein
MLGEAGPEIFAKFNSKQLADDLFGTREELLVEIVM